jgi:hypothetical protein
VGQVSTCGKELLRGWWRPIGLMESFMIFTASARNILHTTSYMYLDWVIWLSQTPLLLAGPFNP